MTTFYINQGYLSYKDNKKIYYCDTYIIRQVVPLLNPPENLESYVLHSDEAKIITPNDDHVSGEFLGLIKSLGYLTVPRDDHEHFFDYGYNKENSKALYSIHKMKIPNSFSSTIFIKHRIQLRLEHFQKLNFLMFSFLASYHRQGRRHY